MRSSLALTFLAAVSTFTLLAGAQPMLLGGSDDCNQVHTDLGIGPIAGVPFTTGTTGSAGQVSPCGGIARDVWYTWTADRDGRANLRTCGQTSLDTHMRVWPFLGSSSCPVDGSAIACAEQNCPGSTVSWEVRAGETFTLQLGVRPGGAGGGGSFEIRFLEGGACGRYDDGSAETAFGHAQGEIGWLQMFDCMSSVDSIQTAYGSAYYPGTVTNGAGARVALYDDLDEDWDPRTSMALLGVVSTVVTNGNTDILNDVPLQGAPVPVVGGMTVLATANHHAGEYHVPLDVDNPTPNAWVLMSTLGPGSLNLVDLAANGTPPIQMQVLGLPSSFLLRAIGTEVEPGAPYCFGDGSGSACPCGNAAATGAGCANSSGAGGVLSASGSMSASADDLRFHASQLLFNQPALLFVGETALNNGDGAPFGDGLRCAGTNVVRLGVEVPDAGGGASWGPGLGASANIGSGDTRYFQTWYRDPGGPCGSGFNLTPGREVSFSP